mgnify:CR=1 FL=1
MSAATWEYNIKVPATTVDPYPNHELMTKLGNLVGNAMINYKPYPMSPKHRKRLERQAKRNKTK